jgi:hypothetical protein
LETPFRRVALFLRPEAVYFLGTPPSAGRRWLMVLASLICALAFGPAWLSTAKAAEAANTDEASRVRVAIALLGVTEDGEPVPSASGAFGDEDGARVRSAGCPGG